MTRQEGSYKPGNYRIISLRTARRILHVEDCLQWGKIRFELWDYARGQGAAGHADAYLDVDTARVLASELAAGALTTTDGLEDLGGGTVKGQTVARILKVEMADTRNPFRFTIRNGPGTRQASGLISPEKGATMTSFQILLSRLDAKRVGLAVLHHLQAWAAVTYQERLEAGTWQPRGGAPTEAAEEALAQPARAEPCKDEGELRYGDGAAVSGNAAEIEAFRAYAATEGGVPDSVEALRWWVRQVPRGA